MDYFSICGVRGHYHFLGENCYVLNYFMIFTRFLVRVLSLMFLA